MNLNRLPKILLIVTPLMLLLMAIGTSRIFDEKITNSDSFLAGLSPWYYVAYYFIVLIDVYILFRKRSRGNAFFRVHFILMLAFALYFPLMFFKYPFQTELYKQAEVFYLLSKKILGGSDSFGTTIFAAILTEISGINAFVSILYILPILLYILTVLFMYISIKMLMGESIAFYATLFFLSAFFELFFTNRYSFAEPLYILMLLYVLEYLKGGKTSANSLIMIILYAALTITHIAFSTFTVLLLLCVVSSNFFQKLHVERIQRRSGTTLILFITIFLAWNTFQWINMVKGTYDLAMHLINSIFQGIFEINVFGSLKRANPKLEYETLVYGRSIVGSLALMLPLLHLILQLIKNKRSLVSSAPLLMFYVANLMFVVLGIGWITNSLRPYQLAITFAPFLLALAMEPLKNPNLTKIGNAFLKLLSVQTIICLMLIVFLLWIPNLIYIGVPSRKVELIRFATSHLPYRAQVYAVGWGEVDEGLFTTVLGDRWDLFLNIHELDSIGTYLLSDVKLENISIPTNTYIYIDYSATRFELKYNLNISSKIEEVVRSFSIESQLGLVYTNSKYMMWAK